MYNVFVHNIGTRHSDVPFFQGIVQVTAPLPKFRNKLFYVPFPSAGTVPFQSLLSSFYIHILLLDAKPVSHLLRFQNQHFEEYVVTSP